MPKKEWQQFKETVAVLGLQFGVSLFTSPDSVPPLLFATAMTLINAVFVTPYMREINKDLNKLFPKPMPVRRYVPARHVAHHGLRMHAVHR
jgi:hypothetical protein